MKSWAIYLLLTFATCTSVYCYNKKFDQHPNDLEKITAGLNGISAYLSYDISINVVAEYGDKPAVACMVGYTLAPYKINMTESKDTILFLFPNDIAPDNPNFTASKKMVVIWQNNAYGINYILARKQTN